MNDKHIPSLHSLFYFIIIDEITLVCQCHNKDLSKIIVFK